MARDDTSAGYDTNWQEWYDSVHVDTVLDLPVGDTIPARRCDWYRGTRVPSTCLRDATGTVTGNDNIVMLSFCDKHMGRYVLNASEYASITYSNMEGSVIKRLEKHT
jgi:hypothetical protein